MSKQLLTICVFCGSSNGNQPEFVETAKELGHLLAKRGIRLVYGGGSNGLMGVLAKSVQSNGGSVLGIIPRALNDVSGETIGESIIVGTMHERKQIMSKQADAFIALPGGFGTLEELIETTTWSQLRIHSKPIGVLNCNGFYNHLKAWVETATAQGFISPAGSKIMTFADTVEELLDSLEQYRDPIGSNGPISFEHWQRPLQSSDI